MSIGDLAVLEKMKEEILKFFTFINSYLFFLCPKFFQNSYNLLSL